MKTHPKRKEPLDCPEATTSNKRRRITNQTGRGDGDEDESDEEGDIDFMIQRPVEANHFVLEVRNSKSFKGSNKAREITYTAQLKYPAENVYLNNVTTDLHALFDAVLNEGIRDYGEAGVMRIYINHPKLESAIIIPPTHLGELDSEVVMGYIDAVLKSAGQIPLDEEIEINVALVEILQGSGRLKIHTDADLRRKKSVACIESSDNACLPRAIIVAYYHALWKENPNDPYHLAQYKRMIHKKCLFQERAALKMRAAVGIPDRPGHMGDIKRYEDYLQSSITVYSRGGEECYYDGQRKYQRYLFIYYEVQEGGIGHFNAVTKVNAMMCKQYYCVPCRKGFDRKQNHNCKFWCRVCGRSNCVWGQKIICPDCNQTCRNFTCFEHHKKEGTGVGVNKDAVLPSLCEKSIHCPDCEMGIGKMRRDPELHVCGESYCRVCQQYYLGNHYCYMRASSTDLEPSKFIFYDFECQQDTGTHIPNLVIAHSICPACEHEPVTDDAICFDCGSRCNICKIRDKKTGEYVRYPCSGCGQRQVEFSGRDTNDNFCSWLLDEQHKNFTCIAHNARGYDAYFIYQYIATKIFVKPQIIFSGSKIMYMRVGGQRNIRFLDSLNFLPMPLASLPKAFGLDELKKGFFPHYYNTPEHEHDQLPGLPDMKYYDPNAMSKGRREEFFKWYELNRNKPFDFQKEMREYCISDVDILLRACWKFRELMRGDTKQEEDLYGEMMDRIDKKFVDPYAFITIASVCMGIFRSQFLPETWSVLIEEEAKPNCKHEDDCQCTWLEGRYLNTRKPLEVMYKGEWTNATDLQIVKKKFAKSPIGLVPPHGYEGADNHSTECLQWLQVFQKQWRDQGININIQHARSPEGEKVVPYTGDKRLIKYKLDGYFQHDGQHYALEYNGCSFHGCLTCYPYRRDQFWNKGKNMIQRHRETLLKERRLREKGFRVISIWSCEFRRELRNKQELREFVDSLNIQDPINVRDSYFGGRTNGITLHKEFKDGEKGYYVDFTSLYPDILKYKRFPIGHPTRVVDNFAKPVEKECDKHTCVYEKCDGKHWYLPYFGIMKARFVPPTDLYHPVLPVRCGNGNSAKLKFPLCYKCACNNSQEVCSCTDAERSFIGTYCTPEIEVAMNMGYEINQVFEVLHWPESEMYDTQTKSGGLFTEYINTFLKIKQQASGYPDHIKTEEDKDRYIAEYLAHEGIELEKAEIKKNPGLRSLAKLVLNSFYGKFGQRTNMKKTTFVTDVADLVKMLTDPAIEVTDMRIVNEELISVETKVSKDFEPFSINTNPIIASFCTSWARLKLWSVMNKLGKRVLYCDTDSIIYSAKPGEYRPPLGDYLGELTDELACKELGCKKDKECEGHWIEEFVSCGPKNYTYKVNTGQVVCKVRGFSLNYANSQLINFESMKDSLYKWKANEETDIVTVKVEIRRDKHQPRVFKNDVKKHYGVVYDKRVVLDDFTTIPYGYKV